MAMKVLIGIFGRTLELTLNDGTDTVIDYSTNKHCTGAEQYVKTLGTLRITQRMERKS